MDEMQYKIRRSKRSRKRHIVICLIVTLLLLIIVIGLVLHFIVVPLLTKDESLHFRLPNNLVPEHYVLHIRPHLVENNFTFEGNVSITVICLTPTRKIVLHAKELDILETDVIGFESNPIVKKITRDIENDFLVVHTKNDLKKDKRYQIKIRFSGLLNVDHRGFYWKSYVDSGITKYMAATNFKPTYARRAFPCFDEPAMKASFDITIIRTKNQMSLSNMFKRLTENRGGHWEADIFYPSVKISTYLVAFFIGEFSSQEVKTSNNMKISLWSRSKHMAAEKNIDSFIILKEASLIFDKYLQKLEFPSTIRKIDILLIPNERENSVAEVGMKWDTASWGLIMMDENDMRFNSNNDSDIKRIATSRLAYALAYQLFGNIVTPKWWNDAWLGESIATYLEMVEINEIFNNWNWMDRSVMKLNEYVEEDCSEISHVTSDTANKPSEIVKQLNSFAVSIKGARILRMLNLVMGNNFWTGLSKFLKTNAYKSSDQNEFWAHMTEAQSKENRLDLQTLISNWIHNPGHPLVTVNKGNSNNFRLNQVSCKNSSTVWKIPITYLTDKKKSDATKIETWLLSTNGSIKVSSKSNWLLLNPEQMAFYHTNYDKRNWRSLSYILQEDHQKISAVNRYQLLYDSLYFARKNLTSFENFFNILSYLEKEEDDNVIEFLVSANLSEIGRMVRRRAQRKWKEYIGQITEKLYERKFKNEYARKRVESETELRLKKEILTGVCSIEEPSCVNLAVEKCKKWINENEKDDIDRTDYLVIKLFLCTAIRNGGCRWEDVKNYFHRLNGTFPDESAIYALGCANDQFKLYEALNIGIFEDTKYLPSIFESILDNSNWTVVFNVLESDLDRLKSDSDRLKKTIKILTETIVNHEELEKVKELYLKWEDKITGNERKLFQQLIKRAEKRISRMDYQLQDMVQWLQSRSRN